MTTTILKLKGATPAIAADMPGRSLFETLGQWRSRARQRRHLAELTPERLVDLGIDTLAARREADKPFWRQ